MPLFSGRFASSIDDCKDIDYLWAEATDRYMDFFIRKIMQLYTFAGSLRPDTKDATSNVFYEKLGIHYKEFINTIRMTRAAYYLNNTDLKIYEIGHLLSYSDINYFTKQFKKVYCQTPREYRNTVDRSLDSSCL